MSSFRHVRADQDEHAVAAVFMMAINPRNTRLEGCLLHGAVQAVTDGYLISVGTTPITKTLYVNCNDGHMNGWSLILQLPSPARTKQTPDSR